MLRKLYDWVFSLARHRHATRSLAVVSFAESSFFPIPPDVMLAPMVLGGILGYAIGYFLEPVGMAILSALGKSDAFQASKALFQQYGAWVIVVKGATPIPYKLITISAGIFQFNLALFIVLSVVTRAARFFLVAFVLKRWGAPMLKIVERRLALFTVLFIVLLVGGLLAVKLIH